MWDSSDGPVRSPKWSGTEKAFLVLIFLVSVAFVALAFGWGA